MPNRIEPTDGYEALLQHLQGLIKEALNAGHYEFAVDFARHGESKIRVRVKAGHSRQFLIREEERP